jgi:hypothetical protein
MSAHRAGGPLGVGGVLGAKPASRRSEEQTDSLPHSDLHVMMFVS